MTVLSGPMIDTNFGNAKSACMSQHRNESVQLSVDTHFSGDFCAKEFKTAVVVMQAKARRASDHPVEDSAGVHFVPWVESALFPAVDNIETGMNLFVQTAEFGRVILKVSVEHEDEAACRGGHAGSKCGSFAKIAAKTNSGDFRVFLSEGTDEVP
jgi:hypothetical protein